MSSLLDSVKTPLDVRRLSPEELGSLASEVRTFILENVSKTGGHLASSLGVVELTLALHYIFDTPDDKIVWDVGHQSYCHKIVTGRKERFHTLRQFRGLSGFPKRSESMYDAFDTGHASTAISSALGMAQARELKKSSEKVVAVVGDGSLTGGLAFEGINNVHALKGQFLVVLNDNKMAISKSVGAMSNYLSKIITSPVYNKIRKDIEGIIAKITFQSIGSMVIETARRLEEYFKGLLVPGILFEEMGFKYIGPVDGHNLKTLLPILRWVKESSSPVLLHVVTKKGCGYQHAEEHPESFHGISSFSVCDGTPSKPASSSFTDVFSTALVRTAEFNSKVVAVTAAMKEGCGLTEFARRFQSRFFDVGIAESHAVTFAAGMACEGMIPYVSIYSTFLQRAYDNIIHDVALQKHKVILCLDRAGLVGEDGPTHHGVFDIAYLRHIPNLTVLVPRDEHELDLMVRKAPDIQGPVSIRFPRGSVTGRPNLLQNDSEICGLQVLRDGSDGIILGAGPVVYQGLDAAKELEAEGINLKVVSISVIKPLPQKRLMEELSGMPRVITLEEGSLAGGFGSLVLEFLSDHDMISETQVLRIGIPDSFVEHGTLHILREKLGLNTNAVAARIRDRFFIGSGVRSVR